MTFFFQQISIASIQAAGLLSAYDSATSIRRRHCADDKRAAIDPESALTHVMWEGFARHRDPPSEIELGVRNEEGAPSVSATTTINVALDTTETAAALS
jgi:hypothetical protein